MFLRGMAAIVVMASMPFGAHSQQLTGSQVASALLPPGAFGTGYAAEKDTARNSGPHLETAGSRYRLATLGCNAFEADYTRTGFGETAMATNSVDNPDGVPAYGQIVYEFRTGSAAAGFLGGLREIGGRCGSFNRGDGARIQLRIVPVASVGGHPAFWLDETITLSGYTSRVDSLLTAAGTDVFGIASIGLVSAPPTKPAPAALLARLIARF